MSEESAKKTIAKVLKTIAPEVDIETIDPDENLREAVDLDSVDFLNFLVGLHDELGVDIPESDYGELVSLSDIIKYLSEHASSSKV